jgi:tetratricopeptide (TPR) repeat protein
LSEGRKDSALSILRSSCELPEERLPCLQLLAQTLASEGASDELNNVLEKAVSTACAQRLGCAEANRWVAAMHVSVGNRQQAVTWYERAARQDPTATRWLDLADAADQAGLPAVVAQALGEAANKKDAKEQANAERLSRLNQKHPGKR